MKKQTASTALKVRTEFVFRSPNLPIKHGDEEVSFLRRAEYPVIPVDPFLTLGNRTKLRNLLSKGHLSRVSYKENKTSTSLRLME